MEIPELELFYVFDGLPPKEEGEDPTVMFHHPPERTADQQYNDVGFFQTLIGFSHDFNSSKPTEIIQTDRICFVLQEINDNIWVAAGFRSTNPQVQRQLQASVKLVARSFVIFKQKPVRNNEIIEPPINSSTWMEFESFLPIFKYSPYMRKMPHNERTWELCQRATTDLKFSIPFLRQICFIYDDLVIHNTMDMRDVECIYYSVLAKIEILTAYSTEFHPNELQFIFGLSMNRTEAMMLPITLSSGQGTFFFLRYNDLRIILLFPIEGFRGNDIKDSITKSFEPHLHGIEESCKLESTAQFSAKVLPNIRCITPNTVKDITINKRKEFTDKLNSDLVRFCGQESKTTWQYIERDDTITKSLTCSADSFTTAINTSIINASNKSCD